MGICTSIQLWNRYFFCAISHTYIEVVAFYSFLFTLQRWEIIAQQLMFKKGIDFLTPNYFTLKTRMVFLLLFLTAFFVRFPFFFRDYIDRDESTFILMGQSWVDGHLPFTELWDLKPPITYFFFASIIYIFGKSMLIIRLFGTLLVVITAFFTYKITEEISSKKIAFWAAISCVFLQSIFGSLQGVMSEHICMAFFMPALYLLIKHQKNYWYVISGILMGLAVMTKLNLAYAILILGLYQIYLSYPKKEFLSSLGNSIAFGMGIILVIVLTILPYFLEGITETWWKSVILAPLEYSNSRRYPLIKLAPTFILLTGFFIFLWKKRLVDFKNPKIQILFITILGVLFSFIKGGRINGHYLIQLHPILIVLVAIAVSKITVFKKFGLSTICFLFIDLASYGSIQRICCYY